MITKEQKRKALILVIKMQKKQLNDLQKSYKLLAKYQLLISDYEIMERVMITKLVAYKRELSELKKVKL